MHPHSLPVVAEGTPVGANDLLFIILFLVATTPLPR